MRRRPLDENYYDQQNQRAGSSLNNNVIADYLTFIDFDFNSKPRVLDIGCRRSAATVAYFHALGCDSYGCDIGEEAEVGWHSLPFKDNLKRADIHNGIPFEGQFDLISISHTLEHCHDPEKVLAVIKAGLKPNGFVWGIVPVEHTNANHTPHYCIFHSHEEHKELYDKAGFQVVWEQRHGIDSRLWLQHKIEE